MLKMKIDPAICMKTQEIVTTYPIIGRAFWPKIHRFRDNGRQSIGLFGRTCADYAINQGRSGAFRACPERLRRVGTTIMATIMAAALHYVLETKGVSDG
jgi:hypothetical protein